MNFDYIPLDKAVIDENVKKLEQNRKIVLDKVRFDDGFENSIIALNFLNELIWTDNIRNIAFNVAYDYLDGRFKKIDDRFEEILVIVSRWARAFKCAYDHSSHVNFSWTFRELLKEVKPLIDD